MTLWTLGMGISGSLVAAAIAYWITEHNLVSAVVIGGTGVVVFILTLLFTKKPSASGPPSVIQKNKQEFNPQFNPQITVSPNIQIHSPAPSEHPDAEKEFLRQQEKTIIEFLRKSGPYSGYDYEEVSKGTNLTKREARDALERLKRQRRVRAEGVLDAKGGYSYFLDEVEHNDAPAPQKTNELRCNIQFLTVETEIQTDRLGQSFNTACAIFENKYIEGQKLRTPTLKARLIFKHPDGHLVLDLANAAWWPEEKIYAPFSANSPRRLLLFFDSANVAERNVWARSVRPAPARRGRYHSRIVEPNGESHLISEMIETVEVQLLTENECLYRKVLKFEDDGIGFPKFIGAL